MVGRRTSVEGEGGELKTARLEGIKAGLVRADPTVNPPCTPRSSNREPAVPQQFSV
jgi:hypothetical protein